MAVVVTITAPTAGATVVSGSPTVTWTVEDEDGNTLDQTFFQCGAYRVEDRTRGAPLNQAAPPPFDYMPVAASGYPNLPYGVVPNPIEIRQSAKQFTFSGAYPSTGALPEDEYYVWLHVIVQETDPNDPLRVISRESGVATVRFEVGPNTIASVPRLRVQDGFPLPPPTILSPTANQAWDALSTADGPVQVGLQFPDGIVPSEVKVAGYRRTDWNFDTNQGEALPLVYTDRAPYEAPTPRSAEWIDIAPFEQDPVNNRRTWTLTFDGSEGVAAFPNGRWVVAVRYNSEVTARVTEFDPANGFTREAHRYDASQAAWVAFGVSNSFDNTIIPDRVVSTPTARPAITWPRNRIANEVGSPLHLMWHYANRRGVGQKSVNVRRILAGGTNAGTRYLSRSTAGVYTWVTALATDGTTDIPIRSEELALAFGGGVTDSWGGLTWGTHSFAVRPTSDAGVVGDWSSELTVDVYRRLTLQTFTASVNADGFIACRWTHNGSTGNNRQARYRIQVFDSDGNIVSGTSDRREDQYNTRWPRAVIGNQGAFVLNRTLPSKGPVANGTYNVVLTIWDRYGNQAPQREQSVTVNNTAPPTVVVVPRVYDHNDVLQPGTSGLIEGMYVGIGMTGVTTAIHEVRLERRQFSNLYFPLDDVEEVIATLPRGTASSLPRWNDETVIDGVEYSYRAVSVAANGAETEGAWV